MKSLGEASSEDRASVEHKEVIARTADPHDLFERFRESSDYQEAHEAFFSGKELADDVTSEEERSAFEESSLASSALVGFSKEQLRFEYAPSFYPAEVVKAVDEYVSSVEDFQKAFSKGYNMAALDSSRSACHNILGKTLVSTGMTPTLKLGRALGRLILVDLRLDTFEVASRSDIQRLKYNRKY